MNNVFEERSIWQVIFKMSIPAMIGMFVVVLYNMADTFFLGQTKNDLMIAGVSLATPIFMILITFGSLLGNGSATLISREIGKKNENKAKKIAVITNYLAIIIGLLIMFLIFFFMDPLIKFLGSSEETKIYIEQYVKYIAIAAPFIIFTNTLTFSVRSVGASKESMFGNIIGSILNIVLDPIMILSLKMNVEGAALATLISNIIVTIYFLTYIKKAKGIISLNLKELEFKLPIIKDIIIIGIPVALANFLTTIANIVVNNNLIEYGDGAIAAMGVSLRLILISTLLQVGFCNGVLPILSYFYGAKNYIKFKETLEKALLFIVSMGLTISLLSFIFAKNLVMQFVSNKEIISTGVIMIRSMLLSGGLLGISFLTISLLQAIERYKLAIFLSSLRQGLIYIPMCFILKAMFGLDGVINAQFFSDILTIIFASFLIINILKKLNTKTINEEKII